MTKKKMKENEATAQMDYLRSCLKSTPKQRLDWLEDAQLFIRSVRPADASRKRSK